MTCAGPCWCSRGRGVHSLFLFALLGSLGVPGNSSWAVLVAHGDLFGFPLGIGVCVWFVSGDVDRDVMLRLVLLCMIL